MADKNIDKKKVLATLDRILEAELAGVVRYTHYSFMIFGYSRIPVISWFESQANESLAHARQVGEMITHLGGEPSLAIGKLLDRHDYDMSEILRKCLEHERSAQALYRKLLSQTDVSTHRFGVETRRSFQPQSGGHCLRLINES